MDDQTTYRYRANASRTRMGYSLEWTVEGTGLTDSHEEIEAEIMRRLTSFGNALEERYPAKMEADAS